MLVSIGQKSSELRPSQSYEKLKLIGGYVLDSMTVDIIIGIADLS